MIHQEVDGRTMNRAKLIRAEYAQAIEEHWSRGPLRRNGLAEPGDPWVSDPQDRSG